LDIKKEDIRVIITASGAVFVGQETEASAPGKLKLDYPFRFINDQASGVVSVAAPVFREDWIVIDMAGAIECAVNQTVEDLYRKYCQQIFGGIIMPEEKKIII
jgi:hypothetical protein